MPGKYDPRLQALYRQSQALDAHQGSEHQERIQKWGDAQLAVRPSTMAAPQFLEYCFVDIGPFPTPIPVRLDAQLSPRNADVVFGGVPLRFTYRLVWSVGASSVTQEFPFLPRQMNVRSLQVYVRRNSGQALEPQQTLTLWATPVNSPNPTPTPIDFEEVSMGIGTAIVDLLPPPRLATHITAWGAPGTNLQLYYQFSLQQLATPFYRLPLFNQTSNAPVYMPMQPLPTDVVQPRLLRGATTAAESFAVAYLR